MLPRGGMGSWAVFVNIAIHTMQHAITAAVMPLQLLLGSSSTTSMDISCFRINVDLVLDGSHYELLYKQ